MKKENKKVFRVIGISCLVVAGITFGYQYQYNKVKTNTKIEVVVATKPINIDQVLSKSNTTTELREKSTLTEFDVTDQDLILGSVATEPIYANENINQKRILSEDEYLKKDYRLVSINGSKSSVDTFVGYDVIPFDKVDLLYFEENGEYEGEIYLEDQVIYDLRDSNGVSYAERGEGWKPAYALIWVNKDIAQEINERQESGGYFKLQLHRDRATK